MTAKRVLTIDEIDRNPAQQVGVVDQRCRDLAVDLIDTMRASPACVGIAAPQIGVALRAFVVDVTGHRKARSCHGEIVLFDPEILTADAPVMEREGCMSVPDLTGDVKRATSIVVTGLDSDNKRVQITTDAFEARAILHEIDHLDGLVFLDRLASPGALHARRVYSQAPRDDQPEKGLDGTVKT